MAVTLSGQWCHPVLVLLAFAVTISGLSYRTDLDYDRFAMKNANMQN